MSIRWVLLTIVAIQFLCTSGYASNEWLPRNIVPTEREAAPGFFLSTGSLVQFANGERLWSDLIRMRYIGQLSSGPKRTHLIFSARSCDACDANPAIYILAPEDESFRTASKAEGFPFPGRLYAFGPEKHIVRESRLFIGNCLPDRDQVAVWFIRSKLLSEEWVKSVLIVESANGGLASSVLKSQLPLIDRTISSVGDGRCSEVPGRDITAGP